MKFTLFIPTLNERVGMGEILPQIDSSWFVQILVSDGNSSDGTAEFARSRGCDVHVQRKPGIRHAYIEAWPMIRGDAVVTFSPDGNCRVEDIPPLLAKLREGYDMVVASRYFGGAKSEDDDFMTAFGNWMFTSLINLLHRGRYTDAMGIFRAYRTSLFYELDLHKEDSYVTEKWFGTVMGIEPLLSVRAARRGFEVGEVLGFEPKRVGGERKLQIWRWGAAYMAQVLCDRFWWP